MQYLPHSPQTHQRPLWGGSSYSLATVERALAEIEGGSTLERCAGAPTSTTLPNSGSVTELLEEVAGS